MNVHGNLAVRHVLIIHFQRIIHFHGQIVFRLLHLHFRGVNSDQQIPVRRIIIGDIFLVLFKHHMYIRLTTLRDIKHLIPELDDIFGGTRRILRHLVIQNIMPTVLLIIGTGGNHLYRFTVFSPSKLKTADGDQYIFCHRYTPFYLNSYYRLLAE